MRGKAQLSPWEVESTRKKAHLRIHVECVIGSLCNKFSFLNGTISLDYTSLDQEKVVFIDKIVTVCCALVNMNNSVVC